jgi:aspartyl-tRNA(Asn)/glutamyl-tRNA(Gln) amidotransferase subunit A
MTPAGLPSTISALRGLIVKDELSVDEAIRLQRRALDAGDQYGCITYRFAPDPAPPKKIRTLAGIGLAHKDIFHMLGRAPDCGMGRPYRASTREAPVVHSGRENGATVLASLALAEHAAGVTGENPNLPPLTNPLGAEMAVGGSSSGSAVAVAAGLCYGSLGTDTAGSVRIPAATCGIVGFKPSRRLLSCARVAPLACSLDTVGVLARNVVDAGIVFQNSLGRQAARLLFGGREAALAIPAAAAQVRGCRVAVCLDHADPGCRLRPDIRHAIEQFLVRIGLASTETPLPAMAAAMRGAEVILHVEASSVHLRRLHCAEHRVGKNTRSLALTGAAIPATWYMEALGDRAEITAAFVCGAFAHADFLVTPALPQGVPDWSLVHTGSRDFSARALLDLFAWTSFVNYLELPALVMPVGVDRHGRPVSVQLIARPREDVRLLAFASYAQDALA